MIGSPCAEGFPYSDNRVRGMETDWYTNLESKAWPGPSTTYADRERDHIPDRIRPPYQVAIIGGGVAGQTAAVFVGQANLLPACLLEGDQPGGALAQSHSVRNWPGVLDAPGGKIVDDIRQQAIANGIEDFHGTVTRVDLESWPRRIEWQDPVTGTRRVLLAYAVILATGRKSKRLGIPGEAENWGRGVSACAICEGSQFQDQTIVVAGGGDGAIAEAEYLSNIAAQVILVVRAPHFAARIAQARDRVLAKPNVRVVFRAQVIQVFPFEPSTRSPPPGYSPDTNSRRNDRNGFLEGVRIQTPAGVVDIAAQGLFVAIGSIPQTHLFREQVHLDETGHVVLVPGQQQQTTLPGVFAAGDIVEHVYALAPKAADEGSVAALQSAEFLQSVGVQSAPASASRILVGEERNRDSESSSYLTRGAMPKRSRQTITEETRAMARTRRMDSRTSEIIELASADQFEELLETGNPIVLDIYATWCAPCKILSKVLEPLAREFAGRVTFVKLNAENADLKKKVKAYAELKGTPLKVPGYPTLAFWNKGRLQEVVTGNQSRDAMLTHLTEQFRLRARSANPSSP